MKRLLSPTRLSLFSAILLALTFPSWSIHFLVWVALAPLLVAASKAGPKHAAALFFCAGWAFHLLLLHWLAANVFWAGGWALVGWVALSAYLAAYWAILGAVYAWAQNRLPHLLAPLVFASMWTLMEWGQAMLFSGFGWSALAYSQGPNLWVSQWAAIGGGGLITFLAVLANGYVAAGFTTRLRPIALGAAVGIVALAHGGGALLTRDAEYLLPAHRVGIFQSDFSQDMKWDSEYTFEMVDNAARKSAWLAQAESPNLIVWPEALVMADPQTNPYIGDLIAMTARDNACAILAGSVRDNPGQEGYNSLYLVTEQGEFTAHYDKVHLAPMGEYIPFSDTLPFIKQLIPAIGDVSRGEHPKVIQDTAIGNLGPLICFEVLFAGQAAALRDSGADRLVVITNLGWFGASAVLTQELEIARLRAIETRLPLIHAANTGISGVFDPYGRFTPVNTYIDGMGRTYTYPDDAPLMDRAMQRLVGAFDLAEPAPESIAWRGAHTAMAAGVLSALLLVVAARRKTTADDEPGAP